jgi:hypothetical protein
MADSNFRGPVNSMGALEVNAATVAVEALDGPSIFYQGNVLPDLRSAPFAKDGFRAGQQAGISVGNVLWAVDAIPQARTTTQVAALQTVTSAVAMSLVTAGAAGVASAANIAIGVPIVPVGTSVVTYVMALDFGFTTGTTTSNSTAVVVVDSTLFHAGQWIILGNVGNSSASRSLVAQVISASVSSTQIYISPAASTGLSNIPIGQGNLFNSGILPPGTQFGPATASASGHSFAGMMAAGLAKVMNPRETLTRNIVFTGATAVAYSAVVSGWDVWGNPMTELVSMASQTTVAGKRGFKYIGSITSGTTITTQVSVGLGDTIGLPLRVDEWDQIDITWNNAGITNANGFTSASLAAVSSTSGDVRGTVQLSTAVLTGVIATAISATATNGTSRVTVKHTLGVWNTVMGNPVNPIPMFGQAQSTATT